MPHHHHHRHKTIKVWCWSKPDAKVTVALGKESTYATIAAAVNGFG